MESTERYILKYVHQIQGYRAFRKEKANQIDPFLKDNVEYFNSVKDEFESNSFSIETANKISQLANTTNATVSFVKEVILRELKRIDKIEQRKRLVAARRASNRNNNNM